MEVQIKPGGCAPTPPPKALRWEWKMVFISEWGLAGKERKLGAIESSTGEGDCSGRAVLETDYMPTFAG